MTTQNNSLTSSTSACSMSACIELGSVDMTWHDYPEQLTHLLNVSLQIVSLCNIGFGGRGGPEQLTWSVLACSRFSGHDMATLINSPPECQPAACSVDMTLPWATHISGHDMTWHDYPEQLASSMSVCSRFSGHDMTWHDMNTLNNSPPQCQPAAGQPV